MNLNFPLKDGSLYELNEVDIEVKKQSYPGIDVEQEIRCMYEWTLANPRKRKTRRGFMSFVTKWLNERVKERQRKAKNTPPSMFAASHRKFQPEPQKTITKSVGMAALAELKKR